MFTTTLKLQLNGQLMLLKRTKLRHRAEALSDLGLKGDSKIQMYIGLLCF